MSGKTIKTNRASISALLDLLALAVVVIFAQPGEFAEKELRFVSFVGLDMVSHVRFARDAFQFAHLANGKIPQLTR